MDFYAKTPCIIETLKASDLLELQKQFLQLNDILSKLQIESQGNQLTDLDFFRFKKTLKRPMTNEQKRQIRLKFKATVIDFYEKMKIGEAKQLPCLENLKLYQDARRAELIQFEKKKKLIKEEVVKRQQNLIASRKVINVQEPAQILYESIKDAIGVKRDSKKEQTRISQVYGIKQGGNFELPNPDKLRLDGVHMHQIKT